MSEILSHKQLVALVKDLRYSAADSGVSFAAIEARQGLLIEQFAALRLALAEATRERSLLHERVCELVSLLQTAERERDENANVVTEQNHLWSERCETAERERDEATAAANIRAAEHRKEHDLRAQAERERDEARALAVSWEREFNVANHERLRLWDEAENLREHLDQFEAAGFPNVASVLDRIALLSRARETDGAVREAAEVRKHRTTLLSGLAYIARESWWPDDASVTDGVRDHVGKMRDAVDALSSPPRPETKDDDKGGAA